MTLIQKLECRFVALVKYYITRVMYNVVADDVLKEVQKIKRYLFFLKSECANNNNFYEEIVQYVNTLNVLPSNCVNCQ
jgi:hypothetical protein